MRSPSASLADPQKRSQSPSGPPKARTRMSRAVAARRVTAARSPETVSPSTNILRPGTGSVSSKSISSRQWPSARTAWGTVATAAARTTTAAAKRNPLWGFRCLDSSVSALWPWPRRSMPDLRRRFPNQPWGRNGLRPLRRSFCLFFFLRSLRRARRDLLAISRRGPAPAPHRLHGGGRLAAHQLGHRPCVDPCAQPVLQKVGGHQGQPPASDLPDDHRHPCQSE